MLARSMGWGGRLLVHRLLPRVTIPKLAVNLTLVKGFSVVGVFWGAFTAREPKTYVDNMAELLTWYAEG